MRSVPLNEILLEAKDVDDLFATLRSAGTPDAASAFSIDFANAREKLRQYLLGNGHQYILKLVQHAVLAGARSVAVESRAGRTRLVHDGEPPSEAAFADLLGHLLPGGERSPVRPLAMALHAALSLPQAQVRMVAWRGVAACELRATWWRTRSRVGRGPRVIQIPGHALSRDLGVLSHAGGWGLRGHSSFSRVE